MPVKPTEKYGFTYTTARMLLASHIIFFILLFTHYVHHTTPSKAPTNFLLKADERIKLSANQSGQCLPPPSQAKITTQKAQALAREKQLMSHVFKLLVGYIFLGYTLILFPMVKSGRERASYISANKKAKAWLKETSSELYWLAIDQIQDPIAAITALEKTIEEGHAMIEQYISTTKLRPLLLGLEEKPQVLEKGETKTILHPEILLIGGGDDCLPSIAMLLKKAHKDFNHNISINTLIVEKWCEAEQENITVDGIPYEKMIPKVIMISIAGYICGTMPFRLTGSVTHKYQYRLFTAMMHAPPYSVHCSKLKNLEVTVLENTDRTISPKDRLMLPF